MNRTRRLLLAVLLPSVLLAVLVGYRQKTAPSERPSPATPAEAVQVLLQRGLVFRYCTNPTNTKSKRFYLTTSDRSFAEVLKGFWPYPARAKGTVVVEPVGVYPEPLEADYLRRGNLLFRGDPELLERIRELLD
jgi:hypothetical protein